MSWQPIHSKIEPFRVLCGGVLVEGYRMGKYVYCGHCHRKIRRWVWPA